MAIYILSGILYLLAAVFIIQAHVEAAAGAAIIATGLLIYKGYNKKRIKQTNSQEV